MATKNSMRRDGSSRQPPGAGGRGKLLSSTTSVARQLAYRESIVLACEKAADRRQEAADRRQETADLRQEAADLRQEAADLRQEAADQSDANSRAKAELGAVTEAQMREANERLVVATVHAQAMTEAAEGFASQMSYMANHDFLTGLPNRSLLLARLGQAITLAQRHGKKVALLYLDLDHFKHINDSLGHAVGDQLLQSVARRLQVGVRLSDTLCRQGGDEFVVMLAEVNTLLEVAQVAEKLIETVAEPVLIAGHWLHITLSIGISLYPDDGNEAETLLTHADIAMYHAKRGGRNKYQSFTPDMNGRAVARQGVQEALYQALVQNRFVLHYQPKFNIETGVITGAEALIRMQQTNNQLCFPTQFISVAEECGLILPIGKWVLREACRQTVAWLKLGLKIGPIAVNVSAVEFHGKDFLSGVLAILNETGLDPNFLELELTESGLMQDTETTTTVLRALKNLGVQIAIDDFGTGYSSLSYLQRFPIDTLKIDQSFILSINEDTEESAIVSAVIAMGRSLRLRVVAEGIETPQQNAFLRSLHCEEGQGYYFSRPVAAEAFAGLLENLRV